MTMLKEACCFPDYSAVEARNNSRRLFYIRLNEAVEKNAHFKVKPENYNRYLGALRRILRVVSDDLRFLFGSYPVACYENLK